MKVSVAAVPYFWSKQDYIKFYQRVANTAVDIVYLGETVCSKRRQMKNEDWLIVAKLLSERGKQVILSTLTLVEAESELKQLARIASQVEYLIEANDLAAVQIASKGGNRFVAGSAINIYNQSSFEVFARRGLKRWVVPVEMSAVDIKSMINYASSNDIEVEYQVFGRLALAYSARCFTARHHRLAKDQCQFKCIDYPQGLAVTSQEGQSFAQINGIQTQSQKISNLIGQWRSLQSAGVDILRVVPVDADTTIEALDHLSSSIASIDSETIPFHPELDYCNGYWHRIEGMKFVS